MGLQFVPGRAPLRRIKRLDIDADLFLDLFRGMDGKRRLQCEGLPDDARNVALTTDLARNTVTLYIESIDFDEVEAGFTVPELNLTFRQFYGDAQPR